MPITTTSIIEEEQKNPEANTPEAVIAESSKPVLAASSSSNHPFFSEKAKTLSIQERMLAVRMQGLENQRELIKSLISLAKKFLIDLERIADNRTDFGKIQAVADCMSFVKGKVQALHTIHLQLFPNNVNFNQLCTAAIALCERYEIESGAKELVNYIRRQEVVNSLLGTIETIEATFNTGFMNLTVDDQGKIESPTNCLAGCSLM
ncbi:MAG: hypothetical protein P4L65_00325 [Legionella sp.]|nr:hypothetical protein [Legionella sp.]